ncbi:hypothetical protein SSPIM334S_05315 [Streptomyces spiroverticillatus]
MRVVRESYETGGATQDNGTEQGDKTRQAPMMRGSFSGSGAFCTWCCQLLER